MSASFRAADFERAAPRTDAGARTGALARAVVLAGVGLLLAYVALHLAHVWQREPALLVALSPIPLFRGVIAGTGCASVLGAFGYFVTGEEWRFSTSRLLVVAIVLFVVTIGVWP